MITQDTVLLAALLESYDKDGIGSSVAPDPLIASCPNVTDQSRFCEQEAKVPVDHADPYTPVPSLNQIEAFLQWNARRKKGVLDENHKITVRTLQNDWDYLRRDIRGLTGHAYTIEDLAEIETVRSSRSDHSPY